jgi:hypothetical protein
MPGNEARTVEELIDEDKVVLDALFVQLAKVGARDRDEAVDELEDEGGRGVGPSAGGARRREREAVERVRQPRSGLRRIRAADDRKQSGMSALGDGEDVDIVDPDVEEGGRAERDDGRAHVWVRDDLDAKDVGYRPPGQLVQPASAHALAFD